MKDRFELDILKRSTGKRLLKSVAAQIVVSAFVILLTTWITLSFRYWGFSEISIGVIYILSVLIIACVTRGYVYGLAASVANILCFNYFFTEPYYTLHVYNRNYFAAFVVMLLVSVSASTLTSRILDSFALARRNEKITRMLYQITSSLAKASGGSEVASVSVRCISNLMDCDTCFLTLDEGEAPDQEYLFSVAEQRVVTQSVHNTDTEKKLKGKYVLPVSNQLKRYGILCFPDSAVPAGEDEEKLLRSVAVQICIAMERERLADEKKKAEAQAEREKLKNNLLRSISHDLRTPLAGISGLAEILQYNLEEGENRKIARAIYDDANWLTHMVENILSLTKIQEGKMMENMQQEAVEEIVAEAVKRVAKYAENQKITVKIPHDVLFVPMDGKLIIQVLINLIDNAVKHSAPEKEIRVEVYPEDDKVWFNVVDHGTGIPKNELPHVFDLFFRADHGRVDSKRGIGLGLTICKSIIDAHGGSILAENNTEGGATLRFWLPRQGGMKIDGK